MKKRILSLFLIAAVLMAALIGCSSESSGSMSSNESSNSSNDRNTNVGSDPVQKLVMTFVTWTGAPTDTSVVEEKINEILREKFNAEIEMQIYDIGSYRQSMTLALAGGEQIDIMSAITLGYPSLVAQGYLLDLEEEDLLNTYGQGVIQAMGEEYIDACRIEGILYGLPQNRDMAVGRGGMAVVTDYLTTIGYEIPKDAGEIIHISEEELCDILARIKEAYPDMETYRPVTTNTFAQYSDVDQLGGNVFGVLLDYGKELKVENLFTSEAYMEYCSLMYDWNQKGYISQDAATDTTAVATLVQAGTLASYTTGGKPGSKVQESFSYDMTIFQTKEDFIASSSVVSFPWTIPINTVSAELSMQILNEFYINEELSTLLIYGIEGEHYKVMEDGTAEVIRDDSGNSNYGTLGWLAPNQFISYVLTGNNINLWEETKEFNNNAIVSAASGFTFDSSNVATEMASVQNVYDEYQKGVEFGFLDPVVALPEMNDKMMAAGLQVIIDEKQAQLNVWAENNK